MQPSLRAKCWLISGGPSHCFPRCPCVTRQVKVAALECMTAICECAGNKATNCMCRPRHDRDSQCTSGFGTVPPSHG